MRQAVLVVLASFLLAAGAHARSAPAAGGCSRAAAAAAVRAAKLPAETKQLTRERFAGVDRLICHDLTGDGRIDMAVTLASGGTAGDVAWAAFVRAGSSWRLAAANPSAYKLLLRRAGRDLVETQPVYRHADPNCCPTGGFDHRRFHWNGRNLAVVRRWHDAKANS